MFPDAPPLADAPLPALGPERYATLGLAPASKEIHLTIADTDTGVDQALRLVAAGRSQEVPRPDLEAAAANREAALDRIMRQAAELAAEARHSPDVSLRVTAATQLIALERVAEGLATDAATLRQAAEANEFEKLRAKRVADVRAKLKTARLLLEKNEAAVRAYAEAASQYEAGVAEGLALGDPGIVNFAGEPADLRGSDAVVIRVPRLGGGEITSEPRPPVTPEAGGRYRIVTGDKGAILHRAGFLVPSDPHRLKPDSEYRVRIGLGGDTFSSCAAKITSIVK